MYSMNVHDTKKINLSLSVRQKPCTTPNPSPPPAPQKKERKSKKAANNNL